MTLTLEDIARLSGVSRSTVSRVINNDANVSERTRQKVNSVIEQYSFQPNLAARGLAAGHKKVIGLVIPVGVTAIFTDPFFPLLIQGVSSACNHQDYSVMLWLAEPEFERKTITKILYNGLIDGVIVSSMLMDDPVIQTLSERSLPFVLIGRHPTNENICYIDTDNIQSAKIAVQHLLHLGCRKIATITGPKNMIVGMDRYQGYIEALHEYGITVDPELVIEGDFTAEGGYHAMQRLLPQKPDAVFVHSDTMASTAIRAIYDAGLRVPNDIAVIGYDDLADANRMTPPLTTVRQPTQQMGSIAAETLINLIENPHSQPHHIILPSQLIIRESCGSKLHSANSSV